MTDTELNTTDEQIFNMRREGYTLTEIAETVGLPVSQDGCELSFPSASRLLGSGSRTVRRSGCTTPLVGATVGPTPRSCCNLAASVVRELQHRGCTIPQEAFTKKPHNVIKGEFQRPGQIDFAVLCSVNQTSWLTSFWSDRHYVSSILVFWNGSEKNPAEIAPMEDRNYLQGTTATEIGFSRGIAPAGREFIMRHNDPAHAAPNPPPGYNRPNLPVIDHQGIDDAFIEKASTTWYFHDGKWSKLMGAD